jgi:hypothetical protein
MYVFQILTEHQQIASYRRKYLFEPTETVTKRKLN